VRGVQVKVRKGGFHLKRKEMLDFSGLLEDLG